MNVVYEDGFETLIEGAFERFIELAPCESCVCRNRELTDVPVFGQTRVVAFRNTRAIMEFIYSVDSWRPYEINVRPIVQESQSYRWIHPAFAVEYRTAFDQHKATLELPTPIVDEKWAETESIDDILDKVEKIMRGEEFDSRVVVVLDLDQEHIDALFKAAETAGVSVDTYVENSLRSELTRIDAKGS